MLKKRNCSSERFNNFAKFIQTARGKPGFNLTLGWLQSLFSSHSSSGFGPQSHSQIWQAILACPLLGCYSAEMHSDSRWDAAIWGCQVRLPCAMVFEKHLHPAGLSHRVSLLHLARWLQTWLFYNRERCNPEYKDPSQLTHSIILYRPPVYASTQHLKERHVMCTSYNILPQE